MRPDAPLCGAARFEGSDGCALNAGHIERGQPDHLDTCGNRWATVSPTEPPPVDEDALAEARAYERGRADHLADVLLFLEANKDKALTRALALDADEEPIPFACMTTVAETLDALCEGLGRRAADRMAAKQGAASS